MLIYLKNIFQEKKKCNLALTKNYKNEKITIYTCVIIYRFL